MGVLGKHGGSRCEFQTLLVSLRAPQRGGQHPALSPSWKLAPQCTLFSHLIGRFLELHMYMTSALGKNDMKAIGLQMALDLLAKKEKKDSITGLQTRTQPGRPDWNKVKTKLEPCSLQGPVGLRAGGGSQGY